MESFSFGGTTSDSLEIVVKSMPLVPRAERNIESLEISGRNGNLHIDNKNYKAKSYTIECIAKDKTKIDDICKTFVGTKNLILSKYNDRYFTATIKNQIDFSTYLTYLNEFPLVIELDPIAYSTTETTENITATGTITVGGNTEVPPLVTITGTGTAIINGYSVTVTETGITIDSKLMQCYNGTIAKNDKVTLDEFPVLSVGSNTIQVGTGITNIEIKYRKGWL